ncbi:hypothetical protein EPI10_020215 [Gossypium australe]|uniref:Uncharacterized protein n=1 Tax=Gossypium australe TaxID=47621 RepID=A0A5B6WEL8_9ROSI|nr:hypothetical protein EPI10_020215 [Gossypium australe]
MSLQIKEETIVRIVAIASTHTTTDPTQLCLPYKIGSPEAHHSITSELPSKEARREQNAKKRGSLAEICKHGSKSGHIGANSRDERDRNHVIYMECYVQPRMAKPTATKHRSACNLLSKNHMHTSSSNISPPT